ncbi:putative fatty acyl-CoA reductase CG5065 [Chironomus tepperi]|uniref:putative fatty acyl-CoA reductase CG5065 n=1 Tax=Chironomus tepperi TaxID=113505 RepID=UPI00391F3C33
MELLDINKPSISEFYNGRSVFVTGGTGFLGKLVVEKLLRSCPGIENIYFLIRPRHNTHINDRHMKVVNSPAFDLLREKSPEALQKIILIEGDVSCLELGISKTDQEVLFDKVSVIIHAAASVALNDTLKKAVLTNLRSMRELLKLAHQMKNLKSMIHTSTAYCNLILPEIKEKIHPTELDPHAIINLCENFPDDILKEWTPRLLKNHENTYVFAKALAEILITIDGIGLPIAIVRPSIIGACVAEPKVGWTDSYTAITPFIDAVARGMFCSGYCSKDALCDVVPADMVVNTIIAASWTVTRENYTCCDVASVKVYNSVSGDVHPITFEQFADLSVNIGQKYPSG